MTLDTKCEQPTIGLTLLSLIGYANLCYASERSEVDPVNKQMILRTHNVSICSLFNNGPRNRYIFSCILQLCCTIYEKLLDHSRSNTAVYFLK
ncbi:hypothetical protein ALC57_10748 [Trachymyrmex cornetzi]|uniref:PRELI/MSF1 domain-containing protein n=1 Tax=Trachymyrmex cornetzi TaxID=471704 RepID=A0A151J3E1_9HYME|nr:hypothetical protein ALC57_10748 [Trachymyrmex cornetzi]